MKKLICITGEGPGSGKDAISKLLKHNAKQQWRILHLATPIKNLVRDIIGVNLNLDFQDAKNIPVPKLANIPIRGLLVEVGQQLNAMFPNIWCIALDNKIGKRKVEIDESEEYIKENIIIGDVRKQSEINYFGRDNMILIKKKAKFPKHDIEAHIPDENCDYVIPYCDKFDDLEKFINDVIKKEQL